MKNFVTFVLVVFGLVLAGAALAVAPDEIPNKNTKAWTGKSVEEVDGATTVDAAKAHELWSDRAMFIDVRSDSDWEAGRIPGAVHIVNDPGPADMDLNQKLTESRLKEEVAKGESVVFYCNGVGCDRSSVAAAQAVDWGWEEVYYFRNGFPAWKDAGYPVE